MHMCDIWQSILDDSSRLTFKQLLFIEFKGPFSLTINRKKTTNQNNFNHKFNFIHNEILLEKHFKPFTEIKRLELR